MPYPSAVHGVKLDSMDQQPPQARLGREAEENAPRPKHDLAYKRLFSHRRMVADLLRLLSKDLTKGLDLGTLRRLPAEHVGDALRSRRSDLPWRIDLPPHGSSSPLPSVPGHPETCLLLLEFQSRVDSRMAERMLEYAAMLRGDLAREGRVRSPGGGPPPLLPLVVYNGRRPWTAPVELGGGDMGLSVGLADLQPKFKYVLLEVRRFGLNLMVPGLRADAFGVNFAWAQFALENASAEDLPAAMATVARLLKAEGELDLAESFGMWIEAVLEPVMGVQLPSLMDMMEEPPMLAETLDEWAEEKFRLGRVAGMERGIERGIEQGMEQGRFKGRVEGERALLIRLAQRRFGAEVSAALSKLVEAVDDPDRLAEIGNLVVDCATGRELLDRAGRA